MEQMQGRRRKPIQHGFLILISFFGAGLWGFRTLPAQSAPSGSSTTASSTPSSPQADDSSNPKNPKTPSSKSLEESLQALQAILQKLQDQAKAQQQATASLQNPTSPAFMEAQKETQLKALRKLAGGPASTEHFQSFHPVPVSDSSLQFSSEKEKAPIIIPIDNHLDSAAPSTFLPGANAKSSPESLYPNQGMSNNSSTGSQNSTSTSPDASSPQIFKGLEQGGNTLRDRKDTAALIRMDQAKALRPLLDRLIRVVFTEMIRREEKNTCTYFRTDTVRIDMKKAIVENKSLQSAMDEAAPIWGLSISDSVICDADKVGGYSHPNDPVCLPLCGLATKLLSAIDQLDHSRPFDAPPDVDISELEKEVHLLAQPFDQLQNNPSSKEELCALTDQAAHGLGPFQTLSESERFSAYRAYLRLVNMDIQPSDVCSRYIANQTGFNPASKACWESKPTDLCSPILSHHVPPLPSDLVFQTKNQIEVDKMKALFDQAHISPKEILQAMQSQGIIENFIALVETIKKNIASFPDFSNQFLSPALTFQGCDALIQDKAPLSLSPLASSPLCQGKTTLADCLGLTQDTSQGMITLAHLYPPQEQMVKLGDQATSLVALLRALSASTNVSEAQVQLSAFLTQYISLNASYRSQGLETPLAYYQLVLEALQNKGDQQCSVDHQADCHTCLLSLASLLRKQLLILFPKELTTFEETLSSDIQTLLFSELKTFQAIPVFQEGLSALYLFSRGANNFDFDLLYSPSKSQCTYPIRQSCSIPCSGNDCPGGRGFKITRENFLGCLNAFQGLGLWLTAYQYTLNHLACTSFASSLSNLLKGEAKKNNRPVAPYKEFLSKALKEAGVNKSLEDMLNIQKTNPGTQNLTNLIFYQTGAFQCQSAARNEDFSGNSFATCMDSSKSGGSAMPQSMVNFLNTFGTSYPVPQPKESFFDNLNHAYVYFGILLLPKQNVERSLLACRSATDSDFCSDIWRGIPYCCKNSFIRANPQGVCTDMTFHSPDYTTSQRQCMTGPHFCCADPSSGIFGLRVDSRYSYSFHYQPSAWDLDGADLLSADWWDQIRKAYQALNGASREVRLSSCYSACTTPFCDGGSTVWDVLFDSKAPSPVTCAAMDGILPSLLQNTASGGILDSNGSVKVPPAVWGEAKAHLKAFLEENGSSSYTSDYLFSTPPVARAQVCSAYPP